MSLKQLLSPKKPQNILKTGVFVRQKGDFCEIKKRPCAYFTFDLKKLYDKLHQNLFTRFVEIALWTDGWTDRQEWSQRSAGKKFRGPIIVFQHINWLKRTQNSGPPQPLKREYYYFTIIYTNYSYLGWCLETKLHCLPFSLYMKTFKPSFKRWKII